MMNMSNRVRSHIPHVAMLACKRNEPRIAFVPWTTISWSIFGRRRARPYRVLLGLPTSERAHSPLVSTEGPKFSAIARLEGGHLFHMRSSSVMDQRTKTLARLTTRRPMPTYPATSCGLDGPPHDDPQATRAGCCIDFDIFSTRRIQDRSAPEHAFPDCHHDRELDQR
jgi:hypothetical protein